MRSEVRDIWEDDCPEKATYFWCMNVFQWQPKTKKSGSPVELSLCDKAIWESGNWWKFTSITEEFGNHVAYNDRFLSAAVKNLAWWKSLGDWMTFISMPATQMESVGQCTTETEFWQKHRNQFLWLQMTEYSVSVEYSAEKDYFCRNRLFLQKWSLSAEIILFLQQLSTLDCIICLPEWMEQSDMATEGNWLPFCHRGKTE